MVFSSPHFLFLFLPLALLVCLLARKHAYLLAILVVSLGFYFWSAGRDTAVLVGLIVGNFVAARRWAARCPRWAFAALVVANLSVLFYFKYTRFFAANLDALLGTDVSSLCADVVLPAGVSFFVFQAISYLIDVRRNDLEAEPSFVTYGAYQAFFPHLIAGPIVRYRDVVDDLRAPRWTSAMVAAGITRFGHGLLKKVLIADGVAPIANQVFDTPPNELLASSAWLGALAYTLQIYFDFSGYSDMAIGLAQLFGVRFHENFARPYGSRSLTEFWRRWHISLSSWFRDYLYIPLGGSRGSSFTTYRNLLVVFAVTGFWHGAAWTFVLWGLYHGAFLIGERLLFGDPLRRLAHDWLRYFYCLPAVVFGWVLFRAPTLATTSGMWRAMLGVPGKRVTLSHVSEQVLLTPAALLAFALGCLIFFVPGNRSLGARFSQPPQTRFGRTLDLGYTVAALVVCGTLVLSGEFSPFLYFNF